MYWIIGYCIPGLLLAFFATRYDMTRTDDHGKVLAPLYYFLLWPLFIILMLGMSFNAYLRWFVSKTIKKENKDAIT